MIERSLIEALHGAKKGSKQELQTKALKAVFDAVKADGFQDIPLQTPEKQLEIKRFSNEQKKALEEQGFAIYSLTGQSIKALRNSGHKFWSTWHNSPEFANLEALGSMQSEVAVNRSESFLPESNNKTLAQQEDMVCKFSEELEKKVKGVKAIIGQVPDYVELAFVHFDSTKEYLFEAKDDYNYARTKTPTSNLHVANVGHFNANHSLCVNWHVGNGDVHVYVAPLVVPV